MASAHTAGSLALVLSAPADGKFVFGDGSVADISTARKFFWDKLTVHLATVWSDGQGSAGVTLNLKQAVLGRSLKLCKYHPIRSFDFQKDASVTPMVRKGLDKGMSPGSAADLVCSLNPDSEVGITFTSGVSFPSFNFVEESKTTGLPAKLVVTVSDEDVISALDLLQTNIGDMAIAEQWYKDKPDNVVRDKITPVLKRKDLYDPNLKLGLDKETELMDVHGVLMEPTLQNLRGRRIKTVDVRLKGFWMTTGVSLVMKLSRMVVFPF